MYGITINENHDNESDHEERGSAPATRDYPSFRLVPPPDDGRIMHGRNLGEVNLEVGMRIGDVKCEMFELNFENHTSHISVRHQTSDFELFSRPRYR